MTRRIGLIFSISVVVGLAGIIAFGLLFGDAHIGWVILGGAGLFAVALGVLVATYGRQPIYPEGQRRDIVYAGFKAVAIVDDAIPMAPIEMAMLAMLCAQATWRVCGEFQKAGIVIGGNDPKKQLNGHVFHFVPDAKYEAAWRGDLKPWGPKTAGVRGQIPIIGGGGPSIAFIRGSLLDKVLDRESGILVHEACHSYRLWDPTHQDPRVWPSAAGEAGNDPTKTVKARAFELWRHETALA